jgi:aldehyde dehydrogenase (NAD+)
MRTYGCYIDGEERQASDRRTFESEEPATGLTYALVAAATAADVDDAVAAAGNAFAPGSEWRTLAPSARGRLMMRLADAIAQRAEGLAELESRETGKLYKEQLIQLQSVPNWLYYFGGLADKIEGRVIPVPRQSILNYTVREPFGVVAIIKSWNSPALGAFWSAAPALACGNTVVIKPSELASASLVEIAKLATEAGFPPGVFNVVTGGSEVGAALTAHAGVAKISFTGGTGTGRRIAEAAGSHGAHVTLELGGKSANIVCADANLDAAQSGVLAGIFAAAGQTCVAGSRLLIDRRIAEDFVARLAERVATIRIGDPMDPSVEMGPLVSARQLERVESLVNAAVDAGAAVLTGGEREHVSDSPGGHYYRPTILTDLGPQSEIAQTEVFGPVLAVLPFDDDAHAIEIANSTPFGLGAGIWTSDVQRAHTLARQLDAGTVWINTYRATAFNSPFGGFKESGVGRENGAEAIDQYLQTKSVWCELSIEARDPFVMQT